MRLRTQLVAAAAATITAFAGSAGAATLVHAYDFSSSYASGGASYISDLVGSADGQLLNGASVSGGALLLDGRDDYVQFASKIVPTGGTAFSVYLRVQFEQNLSGITEIISQGQTGGPGFYVGENGGGGFRLGDFGGSACCVPAQGAFHDLLLTDDASGLRFSIDNGTPYVSGSVAFTAGGGDTRLGRQFFPYDEFFHGRLDSVRIFSGTATYAEATAPLGGGGVPEPSSWAMLIVGFIGAGGLLRRQRAAEAA